VSRTALRAVFAAVALTLVLLAGAAFVLWADLEPTERSALAAVLTQPRVGLLVLFGVIFAAGIALFVHRLLAITIGPAQRIAEAVRLIAQANPAHRTRAEGTVELQAVARAVNELAEARSRLLHDVEATVHDAKARVEE